MKDCALWWVSGSNLPLRRKHCCNSSVKVAGQRKCSVPCRSEIQPLYLSTAIATRVKTDADTEIPWTMPLILQTRLPKGHPVDRKDIVSWFTAKTTHHYKQQFTYEFRLKQIHSRKHIGAQLELKGFAAICLNVLRGNSPFSSSS